MSRSKKDAVGGHFEHWLFIGDAGGTTAGNHRFAKRVASKAARRVNKALMIEGLQDLKDQFEDEESLNAMFYEMIYEEEYLRDQEDQERWEYEQAKYAADVFDSYYDDFFAWDGFPTVADPEPKTSSDSGMSLGEILERMK